MPTQQHKITICSLTGTQLIFRFDESIISFTFLLNGIRNYEILNED